MGHDSKTFVDQHKILCRVRVAAAAAERGSDKAQHQPTSRREQIPAV